MIWISQIGPDRWVRRTLLREKMINKVWMSPGVGDTSLTQIMSSDFAPSLKKNKLQKCLPFGIRPPASPQCCGVAPGLRSPHSTSRDCPDAFPGVCGHHRGCGALNPPRTKGDILPNPRFHRSRSQFWQNVTFCPQVDSLPHTPCGGRIPPEMHRGSP